MCGIFGHLALSPEGFGDVDRYADSCLDCLRHRGPDDRGWWTGDGICLGMHRLSIIDLEGGRQPLWNEAATRCIVYNGELYNFQDLRGKLESLGHTFRTRSDTEVVLRAYEQWGLACLQRFNGMFAFAIWDRKARTLFLARDRIGEKPVYYYLDGRRLIFASEIKAIVADPTVPRELNPRGLANYLAFGHALAPETMYRGIAKLPPAHCLLVKDGQVSVSTYWDVDAAPEVTLDRPDDEDACARQILDVLEDSVRRRLVADVPVGAFLSGGLDSSAVVALACRHAPQKMETFSVGFTVGGAYDELPDARRVAEWLGTEHFELQVDQANLAGLLEKLVYHYDEPFGDAAGFPVYLLSEFARRRVKVVLTGDGGDELFGGYRRYAADRAAGFLRPFLTNGWARRAAERLPRLRRLKRALSTLPIEDPARRYAAWLILFTPEMQAELLAPEAWAAVGGHDPAAAYPALYGHLDGRPAGDHLNRLMYVDVKTRLADAYMEKVDKATMAASLEARLPFLDHRLVELAFQIPGRQKIKGFSTKRILKRAASGLVPPSVLRKPKHGFSVPTDPWFRGELRSFAFEVLLDDRARGRGYLDTAVVERMWKEHVSGRHVWDQHLWLLINLELWHRTFLDRVPATRGNER